MTKDCGIRNADCGFSRVAMQRTVPAKTAQHVQSIRIPHSKFRNGVTLIELLIVIAIIATLSAVFLGVSTAAMEHSRASRTKAVIAKLHTLLMDHWETYETRRVEINSSVTAFIDGLPISSRARGEVLRDIRLLASRELMKLEMPDRWSDITNNALDATDPRTTPWRNADVLSSFPALTKSYHRRLQSLKSGNINTVQSNQGAECLYMIVMLATGDGEARTLFGEQDIGDTDNDGAPEFLDGWGRPIQFVRWPAGFVEHSDLMSGDGDADHDPLDQFRRDSLSVLGRTPSNYPPGAISDAISILEDRRTRFSTTTPPPYLSAFRLMPLIYSSGSDEDSDLIVSPRTTTELDPYYDKYGIGRDTQLAFPFDEENDGEGWLDNIHNHLQDNR